MIPRARTVRSEGVELFERIGRVDWQGSKGREAGWVVGERSKGGELKRDPRSARPRKGEAGAVRLEYVRFRGRRCTPGSECSAGAGMTTINHGISTATSRITRAIASASSEPNERNASLMDVRVCLLVRPNEIRATFFNMIAAASRFINSYSNRT